MTAWAHLLNAKHIDRILADVKKNPKKWGDTYDAVRDAAWRAAWSDAYDDARDAAAWTAAWGTAEMQQLDSAWNPSYGVIFALIVYDDCAYLLDEKPEDVQMLGLLGNQAAILLYPACVALQKEMT